MTFTMVAYSQPPKNAFNKETVISEARGQLLTMSEAEGELAKFCLRNEIKGAFEIDLTIQGKGEVLTVFMVTRNPDIIAKQNLLKDKLYSLRFSNVKIPKKEKVKFRHTLTF